MSASSASYQSLFDEGMVLLKRHKFDAFLPDLDPLFINLLLAMHTDKLKEADSYEKTIVMINEGMSKLTNMNLQVEMFLKTEEQKKDLKALYELYVKWRAKFLAGED